MIHALRIVAARCAGLFTLTILFVPHPGWAAGWGDVIISADAGYTIPAGYYRDYLKGTYRVNLSALYGNPSILKLFMFEAGASYARYPLKAGSSSYLQEGSMCLGPLVSYRIAGHIQLYMGPSLSLSYLHLHASRYNTNERSFKPGFLARAGLFFPLALGVRLRADFSYRIHYLSGKPFHECSFTGGVGYNFNPDERSRDDASHVPATKAAWHLAAAEKAMKEGDIDKAKEEYRKALSIEPSNDEARIRLDVIEKAESDFAHSRSLLNDKHFFEAIPLLEGAAGLLPDARRELASVRTRLSGEIPLLEKKGVELYEKGEYATCVDTLRRLLLIDPNNRTAQIYLPRAQKRIEAMERLR